METKIYRGVEIRRVRVVGLTPRPFWEWWVPQGNGWICARLLKHAKRYVRQELELQPRKGD